MKRVALIRHKLPLPSREMVSATQVALKILDQLDCLPVARRPGIEVLLSCYACSLLPLHCRPLLFGGRQGLRLNVNFATQKFSNAHM
jgi:hypothetical protein